MDMLFTESIAFYYTVDFFIAARRMKTQFHPIQPSCREPFCPADSLSLTLVATQLTIAPARPGGLARHLRAI
jgi:hypothetical protein